MEPAPSSITNEQTVTKRPKRQLTPQEKQEQQIQKDSIDAAIQRADQEAQAQRERNEQIKEAQQSFENAGRLLNALGCGFPEYKNQIAFIQMQHATLPAILLQQDLDRLIHLEDFANNTNKILVQIENKDVQKMVRIILNHKYTFSRTPSSSPVILSLKEVSKHVLDAANRHASIHTKPQWGDFFDKLPNVEETR